VIDDAVAGVCALGVVAVQPATTAAAHSVAMRESTGGQVLASIIGLLSVSCHTDMYAA
jgi:hypothetical protein